MAAYAPSAAARIPAGASSATSGANATNTTTEAANRTYAVPTYMAMTATSAGEASVGYEGTASDGLTQLDDAHALTPTTSAAPVPGDDDREPERRGREDDHRG